MTTYRKRAELVEADQVPTDKLAMMELAVSWRLTFQVDALGSPRIVTDSRGARPGMWLVRLSDEPGVKILSDLEFAKQYEPGD